MKGMVPKHETSLPCRKAMEMAFPEDEPIRATPNAVEALYRLRHQELLRVATAITGSVELAEDAVQEGLARALAADRPFARAGHWRLGSGKW